MKSENFFTQNMKMILNRIVACDQLHARWLNTLSYLENCGAKKIAACEHPTCVKEEMLKHAAEEFRHAHYLKCQISKLHAISMPDYSLKYLLGGISTLHYLSALDLHTSRYLKSSGFPCLKIREIAYLLVTYVIELRAEQLYPIYESLLRQIKSRIQVKSILLKEKEHLEEMKEGLKLIPQGFLHAEKVRIFEEELCKKWIHSLRQDVPYTN